MLSPTSRLGDDLYVLYLSVLGWFMLPFYGAALHEVAPSQWEHYDASFDIAIVVAGLLGAWSGVRGGPLMITRAAIIHELGSPVSRRRLLLPWMLRQTTAWALVAGVMATIALALADPDSFGYETAALASVGGLLATASANFVAVMCMIARFGERRYRGMLASAVALVLVAPAIAAAAGVSFLSATGLIVVGVTAVVSAIVAITALAVAPVAPLWQRAAAIEAMRSSLQQVDFQRVLLELRSAAERPPYATRTNLTKSWMPLPLWRHMAGIQHTVGWHAARLLAFTTGIGVLFWLSDPSQGVVALAMAGCALLLGLELAGSVAALADQMTFVVHYPQRSSRLLLGQVLNTVTFAVVIASIVVIWRLAVEPRMVLGTILICAIGALGATVQARLGSPDVAAMVTKYGPLNVSKVLWARALAGPALVLVATLAVFHQFLRPEPLAPPLYVVIALTFAVAFVLSRDPLERSIQQRTPGAR